MKIFDFRILGWPEHDFTIFTKCLSVDQSVCVGHKYCGTKIVAQNLIDWIAWNFIFSCIFTKWCWLGFCTHHSRNSPAARNFLFLQHSGTRQYCVQLVVPNTNYFKRIIFKFKWILYFRSSNIIYIFCMRGGNTPLLGGKFHPPYKRDFFFLKTLGISKIWCYDYFHFIFFF